MAKERDWRGVPEIEKQTRLSLEEYLFDKFWALEHKYNIEIHINDDEMAKEIYDRFIKVRDANRRTGNVDL